MRLCGAQGCGRKYSCSGYCDMHYKRVRKGQMVGGPEPHRGVGHGLSHHPLYHTWENMMQRCTNPENTNYKHYGARGIRVCKRWHYFPNFLADIGERPKKMTLDRIDNDGDYELGNIQWATQQAQVRNQRISRRNKTGQKGVWFNKKIGNYQSKLSVGDRQIYLGSFYSLAEAIEARKTAEVKYW